MNPNFLKNTGSKKMRRILNVQITKHGKRNMEIEVFLFRALSVFFLLATFLGWASSKWDCVSVNVAIGFMILSLGISTYAVVFTVCDLVKWIFDRF